jgi:small basic protein
MRTRWNALLQSLVLVRLGQELGSDTQIAQAVASAIDLFLSFASRFF